MKASKKHKNETLFKAYMREKLENYPIQLKREGKKRGEKIGIPRRKAKAAILLGCTALPPKHVASQEDISYAVVRQWNSDPEFQKIKDQSCEEFSEKAVSFLKGKTTTYKIKASETEGGDGKMGRISLKELSDVDVYSNCVIDIISKKYFRHFDNEIQLTSSWYSLDILLGGFKDRKTEIAKQLTKAFLLNAIVFITRTHRDNGATTVTLATAYDFIKGV